MAQRQRRENAFGRPANIRASVAWSVANESAWSTPGGHRTIYRAMCAKLISKLDPERFVRFHGIDKLAKSSSERNRLLQTRRIGMMTQYYRVFWGGHGPARRLVPRARPDRSHISGKMVSSFPKWAFDGRLCERAAGGRLGFGRTDAGSRCRCWTARDWIAGASLWCNQDLQVAAQFSGPGMSERITLEHGVRRTQGRASGKSRPPRWKKMTEPATIT